MKSELGRKQFGVVTGGGKTRAERDAAWNAEIGALGVEPELWRAVREVLKEALLDGKLPVKVEPSLFLIKDPRQGTGF